MTSVCRATLVGMTDPASSMPPRPRVHPMAVLALVCSCVFCCPFAPLAGVILGFFSWRGIAASEGRLRGRSIALLAVLVGLVMLPLQYYVSSRIETSQSALKKEGLEQAFVILFDTSAPERALALEGVLGAHEGRRPSSDDVDRFVLEVTKEYGAFRGVSLLNSSPSTSSTLFQLDQECALYLTFENGTTTGAARCSMLSTGWSTPYRVRFSTLEINLGSGGAVELNPAVSSSEDSEQVLEVPQDDG